MNSFSRLIKPRLPSAALGLTGEGVAVVSLDRRRDGTLLVRRAGYMPLAEGLEVEDAAWRRTACSADRREGIAAFTEKRVARWQDQPTPPPPGR